MPAKVNKSKTNSLNNLRKKKATLQIFFVVKVLDNQQKQILWGVSTKADFHIPNH